MKQTLLALCFLKIIFAEFSNTRLYSINSNLENISKNIYNIKWCKSNRISRNMWLPQFNSNSEFSENEYIELDLWNSKNNCKSSSSYINFEKCEKQKMILEQNCAEGYFSLIFAPTICYGIQRNGIESQKFEKSEVHLYLKTWIGEKNSFEFLKSLFANRNSKYNLEPRNITMKLSRDEDNSVLKLDCINCDYVFKSRNGIRCLSSKIDSSLHEKPITLKQIKRHILNNNTWTFQYNIKTFNNGLYKYWCEGISIFGFKLIKSNILLSTNENESKLQDKTEIALLSIYPDTYFCYFQRLSNVTILYVNLINNLQSNVSNFEKVYMSLKEHEDMVDRSTIEVLTKIFERNSRNVTSNEKNITQIKDILNVSINI